MPLSFLFTFYPQDKLKHTKLVLLNQMFMENAAIYCILSKLPPGIVCSEIYPSSKEGFRKLCRPRDRGQLYFWDNTWCHEIGWHSILPTEMYCSYFGHVWASTSYHWSLSASLPFQTHLYPETWDFWVLRHGFLCHGVQTIGQLLLCDCDGAQHTHHTLEGWWLEEKMTLKLLRFLKFMIFSRKLPGELGWFWP